MAQEKSNIDAVLDIVPIPTLIFDGQFNVSYYNSALQEQLRTTGSQLKNLLSSPHPLWQIPDVQNALQAAVGGRRKVRVDAVELYAGQGRHLLLSLSIVAMNEHQYLLNVFGADGHPLGFAHGTTHLDDERKSIVIGGLMHEINNPLGGIRGAAQMLKGAAEEEERSFLADGIIGDVDRIRSMMEAYRRTMLDEEPVREWFSLQELIYELVHNTEMGTQRPLKFMMELDVGLPEIYTDKTRVTQALTNLLLNAAEFTGSDHVVRVVMREKISAKRVDAEEELLLEGRPSTLAISVEDSGEGVSGSESKLFTPFYTTRKQGTGLGLALSLQLIRQIEGTIVPGRSFLGGASMKIEIPVYVRKK